MTKIALAMGLATLGISGMAQAELSANIGATSNYVWRGVTQTDDSAAIQGGVDYAHDSGFYLGTWASNINWPDTSTTPPTDQRGAEVDLYGGFGGEVSGVGYDIGLIYYWYPNHDDSNFTEINGSVSYGPVTAGLAYTIQSDVDDVSGSNETFIEGDMYYYISASAEVMPTWTLGGTVGYYDFEDDGVAGTDTSYAHYQLDLTKSAGDFGDFTLSLSVAEEESGDDDPKVFVSWSKSF